jgi:hypothetical protein
MDPAVAVAPRAAQWAARSAQGLSSLGLTVWRALEEVGRSRAARELQLIAQRHEFSDPARAEEIRAAIHFIAKTQKVSP